MPDVLMIRERPPQLSVVALLEAEGLPASDLTESHLQHFFFTGSDRAPSALVGLEIYGEAALLRSLVVSADARTQGLGSALVQHAEGYAAARQVRSIYLLTTTAEAYFEHRGYRRVDRVASAGLDPIHARVRESVPVELRLHDQTTVNPTGAQ